MPRNPTEVMTFNHSVITSKEVLLSGVTSPTLEMDNLIVSVDMKHLVWYHWVKEIDLIGDPVVFHPRRWHGDLELYLDSDDKSKVKKEVHVAINTLQSLKDYFQNSHDQD